MSFLIGRVNSYFKFFLKDNFNVTLLGRTKTLWKGSNLNVEGNHRLSDPKDEIYVTCFHFKYSKMRENTDKSSIIITFVETEERVQQLILQTGAEV